MKKIKLSELFTQSAYHETKADDELINAIIAQSQKTNGWRITGWIKWGIIVGALLIIGFLIYWIYTLLGTTAFGTVPKPSPSVSEQTNTYSETRENELFEEIEATLLNQPETKPFSSSGGIDE